VPRRHGRGGGDRPRRDDHEARPPGVTITELSPEIAIESTRLPGDVHGDAADRMLIASARVLGAVLVTCDERILDYAASGHVRVLDARA
jgi:PIN domain nuclease of toxin-antitoxin system